MAYVIVNNTGSDIRLIMPALHEFAKTGELDVDVADLFKIEVLQDGDTKKLLVDFADD